ncbi:hypothetical protein H6G65_02950 [Microcystis elabens FACHB-917]|nr:hypothetical protein [Microcystis elabens FACHB-917]
MTAACSGSPAASARRQRQGQRLPDDHFHQAFFLLRRAWLAAHVPERGAARVLFNIELGKFAFSQATDFSNSTILEANTKTPSMPSRPSGTATKQ